MNEVCGFSVKEKWYKRRSFPILPIFETSPRDEWNPKKVYFSWLFLTIADSMAPSLEVSVSIHDVLSCRVGLPYVNIWLNVRVFPHQWHFKFWRKGTRSSV